MVKKKKKKNNNNKKREIGFPIGQILVIYFSLCKSSTIKETDTNF